MSKGEVSYGERIHGSKEVPWHCHYPSPRRWSAGLCPPERPGRSYAEAPTQVMTKGLSAEEHLLRQVELSQRLVRELPAEALEKAIRVPLPAPSRRSL